MPPNRRPVPKEQKRDELLAAAALLFVTGGYEGASIARIAKQAGVTATTLYWYFADKDELLVAVADRYLQALLAEHEKLVDRPLADQLVWVVEQLRPIKHLVATIHDRAAVSEAVCTWHEAFHRTVEDVVQAQLPHPIPDERRAAEAAAATFTLEGAVVHDVDDATVRQLCEIVVARLLRAGR